MEKMTKDSMKQAIVDKLRLNFGCTEEEATEANIMKACAMVLRDRMSAHAVETRSKVRKQQLRQVHYMSLEFLMGRSLMKNAYNLGVAAPMRQAIEELGFKPAHIFDMEISGKEQFAFGNRCCKSHVNGQMMRNSLIIAGMITAVIIPCIIVP